MVANTNIAREDRFVGAIVGGAIGDALGMPAESMSATAIERQWGSIQTYCAPPIDSKLASLRLGQITDDTQLMLATLQYFVEPGAPLSAVRLGHRYIDLATGDLRGAGRATWRAISKLEKGVPPSKSGDPDSRSCGAVSRAWVAVWLSAQQDSAMEAFVDEVIRMTHRHDEAVGTTYWWATMIQDLCRGKANLRDLATVRMHPFSDAAWTRSGPTIWSQIDRAIEMLDRHEKSVVEVLGSSGAVFEVVPTALHCFLRNRDDFHACVTSAVNAGGDTDTRAYFAGQLWGAYRGYGALPEYLVRPLEDVDDIVALARAFFRKWGT